jgi:hypothetical protein
MPCTKAPIRGTDAVARLVRFGGVLLAAMALACAGKVQVQPTPFKDSAAFKKVRKDALGFLDHDFNADGVPDAVVVTRENGGMRTQVFVQTAGEQGGTWSNACSGPTLAGEELDTLRWVKPGDRVLLLVVASTENPDTLQQSFALLPESQPCTAVFQEQVSLQKPAYELVSPGEVPGGVLVDDGGRVHVIDRAQTVQLRGAAGEVEILKSVRERVLTDDGTRINVTERPRSFVAPRSIKVAWRREGSAPEDLPVLTDEKSETSFVVKSGEDGVLDIDSGDTPMVILDVAHGCGDGDSGLTLTPETATEDTHVVGATPDARSFVQGVGHRPRGAPGERRDVLVLRDAVRKLALRVGPNDVTRCLRDVRAYGFLSP